MTITKNITCICCPIGCELQVNQTNEEFTVIGNKCLRGKKYAHDEITHPKRIITSTIKIIGSNYPVISVKTTQPVPKEKIFTIMEILASLEVIAPIYIGDILLKNIANTTADIVATKTVIE